jgi:Protein of unknown function (DUF3570)
MQLKHRKSKRKVADALFLLTANLLNGSHAVAQVNQTNTTDNSSDNYYDQPVVELGKTTFDSSVVFYREGDSRVQAIEPMMSINHTNSYGDSFSLKYVYDTLTGATPNGATRANVQQTFVSPGSQSAVGVIGGEDKFENERNDKISSLQSNVAGSLQVATKTGASGGGVVVVNPTTGVTQVENTVAAGRLPTANFTDKRSALDLGYATDITTDNRLSVGLNLSSEGDFRSFSGRAMVAHKLESGVTTLSMGANIEKDTSEPHFGIPQPMGELNGGLNARSSDDKTVGSLIFGVSRVMTRTWYLGANFTYGSTQGYQSDPYKLVSVVSPTTGAPSMYLSESRPDSRQRTAVYLDNKLAVGSWVTNLGLRYYQDDWGISSVTAELAEHIPVGRNAYIQPSVRYYHQSAADFFTNYLVDGQPLPTYASADSRLDSFNATTVGIRGGMAIADNIEIYGMAEFYLQNPAGAEQRLPGSNSNFDLFSGTDAYTIMTGIKFSF